MIDLQELSYDIRSKISDSAANAPRSKQKHIGPSEVGTPCIRRIGYRLLEVEPVNNPDNWLTTIGTAVHTWLADAYLEENAKHHPARYLVEHRVEVADGLAGSVDLYDVERKLVMDWKVVGDNSLRKYRSQGPGDQYRTQVHLYGLGFKNKGYDVEHVAICFLPRGGSLRGLHIWSEPFNEEVARAALDRLSLAKEVTTVAGRQALPLLPATDAHCNYCPFFLPASTDLSTGCPGPSPTQPN